MALRSQGSGLCSQFAAIRKEIHGEGGLPREGGQRGRKQAVISLQDVRTMVGTQMLLGSGPRRQGGQGTLGRGTKRLERGRNAENQRGKAGMTICMYKTVKNQNPSQPPASASDPHSAAWAARVNTIQHDWVCRMGRDGTPVIPSQGKRGN